MKALSIKNPWAWLIASGYKDIENRSWRTSYRGTFLVHVSGKWDNRASDMSQLFSYEQWDGFSDSVQRRLISQTNMPTSAIIGQVDLIDCVENHRSMWAEYGQWHWVLDNPIFWNNYIPDVKGKLGFWEFNNSLEQNLLTK